MKLNAYPKKKKKSAVPPKTRNAKLAYQLRKNKQNELKREFISDLDNKELRTRRDAQLRTFGNDNANLTSLKSKKSKPTSSAFGEQPALVLVYNPAADDSAQPISIDYVSDTIQLSYPVRHPELFVLCSKCKFPVSTGLAAKITTHGDKFSYEHQRCVKIGDLNLQKL